MQKPRSAAIYTRLSSDPEGLRAGVRRQREDCEELAKRLGWAIGEVYEDDDYSASTGKRRPAYERMLADCEAGRRDGILVYSCDRLTRRLIELATFLDWREQHNIPFATTEGDDTTTANGRMVVEIKGVVAQQEARRIGERVKRAHRQLREAGKPNGGRRPYGYRAGGAELEPAEVAVLREAAERLLAGESLWSVTRDFNARGIRTAEGHDWFRPTLRDQLISPRRAGLRTYQGKVTGPATWPAIFTADEHAALVHLLTDPARRTATGTVRKHLLPQLATCYCGQPIISGGSQKGYATYRCYSRKHLTRKAADVDDYIIRLVTGRLDRPDARELLTDTDNKADAQAIAREIELVQARLAQEASAYAASDDMTPAEYQAIVATLRRRLKDLSARQARLVTPDARVLAGLVGQAREVWDSLDLSRQRAVVDTLMRISLQPAGQGSRYFRPESVLVTWKK